jgi:hypothetical protein
MSNPIITPDEEYDASVGQPIDADLEALNDLPLLTKPLAAKAQAAKQMACRRSIEELKEQKRLRALISDYDFDDEL